DRFKGGAGEMCLGSAARQSDDRSPRVLIPVRRAKSGEGGNEIHSARVADAGGECFYFSGGSKELEAIAQPLDDRAGDEDASLEGVFGAIPDAPRDSSEQVVLR